MASAPRPAPDHPGPASRHAGLPPHDPALEDVDPATFATEEDEEARLPEAPDESAEALPEGRLAFGHAAIEQAVRHAPTSPGVYIFKDAGDTVIYVGKAKNVRSRVASYFNRSGDGRP